MNVLAHLFAAGRRGIAACLLLAAGLAMSGQALGASVEAFPNKPVRIIVPSVPGGLLDTCARLVSAKLSGYWKVPVVVENRPGAGMAIGTNEGAKAAPDGYTLLLSYEGAIVINPLLVAQTPYSTDDFAALAQVWDTSLVLLVNQDVPAQDFAELSAYIKANPGKLNYPVADQLGLLMSGMLKEAAGWDYVDIMYKGNGERLRSVMAGETQLMLASASDAAAAVASGRVRAMGLTASQRSQRLPDIPTLDELGLHGFSLTSWGGLFAPAATPQPVLAKLRADAQRAMAEPDVVATIEEGGSNAGGAPVGAVAQRIKADVERWREQARRLGMNVHQP